MEHPRIYDVPMLDIDKAIKATQDYIKELEQMKHEGFTNKQAVALAKFTQEHAPIDETEEE